ncbi:MAG: DUF1501 domain-containing protein [Verrucomicrobiota bacterium]
MLDIQGSKITRTCEGLSRRDFVRVGSLTMMGLSLSEWFALKAAGAIAEPRGGAKAVIQLWMGGGPTQTDTFDPKPDQGVEISGPLRSPIQTNVKGIRISELLPLLGKQADKYSILRSMTHMNNGHETATYMMMTGTPAASDPPYPALGAVVAYERNRAGYAGTLPPYITLTSALGRFSEAGFLGNNYRTFAPGGDPNNKDFRVQGLVPPRSMSDARIQERRSLLQALDSVARETDKPGVLDAMDDYEKKAYGLILGDAKKAFDLSEEKDALRDKYGRHHFGQSCLLARRLVERGVPFVTINYGGWDTHVENHKAMQRLLPPLDSGFATLLEDLAQRGLLESTIVIWYGEFGRTPRIANEAPWFGGRHHFGNVFSAVVAGGGFKGGQVIGSSDTRGENVKDRPVYPWDLSASMYRLLGIDPMGQLPHPQGCVAYITPLAQGKVQSGGLLTEIMPSSATVTKATKG